MMIVLRHARFISSGRIYKSGSVLPDSEYTRSLVEKGYAEIANDTQPVKAPAKKSKAETVQQNDTVNS